MVRIMELRNLYSFLRVTELGSFTKAAAELNYAQSTVTMQIKQLEDELGVPLFERIGKKNMLTAYGQQLVEYANQMLYLENQIFSIGKEGSEKGNASLRIGVVESIMCSLISDSIWKFNSKFPDVKIQIRLAVTETLFDLLRHNEVDIILTIGDTLGAPDLVHAGNHKEEAVFISSESHHLALQSNVSLQDVFSQPFILTGDNTFIQHELYKRANEIGATVRGVIQTESSRLILEFVRQNLGLSLLPKYMICSGDLGNGIKSLEVKDFYLPFYVNIYYHRNKWLTPQAKGFIDLIGEHWR